MKSFQISMIHNQKAFCTKKNQKFFLLFVKLSHWKIIQDNHKFGTNFSADMKKIGRNFFTIFNQINLKELWWFGCPSRQQLPVIFLSCNLGKV